VAVTSRGAIGVSWYDFAEDRPGDAELWADERFASSLDRGASWHRLHVAGPTDVRSSPISFLAYQSLAPMAKGFGALFVLAAPQARYGAADVEFARIARVPGFGAHTNVFLSPATQAVAPGDKLVVRIANHNHFKVAGTLTLTTQGKFRIGPPGSGKPRRRVKLGASKFTVGALSNGTLHFKLPALVKARLARNHRLNFVARAVARDPRDSSRQVLRVLVATSSGYRDSP
jgi:hypothetical protein